ncbi:hypothetical protein [Candidatus Halocynthiibacter alkanivorans]|uniref:hypothetical protein n=1 Tax=Candidatus Halocynthiibacter alkanivorans TaxID=2267619 RepID=UPI000DF2938A|nr:hypothetical protein [Candidatus Halocynthiibacter alkanivorans]
MYGVILWNDPAKGKAVIWCDDHGHLAYLSSPEVIKDGQAIPDVGAMVNIIVRQVGPLRLCTWLECVNNDSHPTLLQSLRNAAVPSQRPAQCSTFQAVS